MKRFNRREFLAWAGAGATGALLAACAPTPATPEPQQAPTEVPAEAPTEVPAEAAPTAEAPASGQVEIRVSVWGDVIDQNINNGAAAGLAEVDSTIKIATESYPGGYYDKVKVNFAGGTSADVVYVEGYQWQPFADQVVPLEDLIERDGMQAAWPDVQNYTALTSWRGHTYLTVIDTGPIIMFYNKDLFDKQGVAYPTDDWTFDDFKAMVPKLTFEEDGVKYYGYTINEWGGGYVWWISYLRMDGKLEFDRIVEPTKAMWDQPEIMDALQFDAYDVVNEGWSPSPDIISGGGVTLSSGRAAMTIQGPWYLSYMRGEQALTPEGLNFDVVLPPRGAAGVPTPDGEIQGHMLAKQSKYPEQAWTVMKHYMGEDVARITAEQGRLCGTPENTDKYWVPLAQSKFGFSNGAAFVQGQLNAQCPMCGGASANYTALTGAGGPLSAMNEAMLGLQKTAAEAVPEANAAVQRILDDYWAAQTSE